MAQRSWQFRHKRRPWVALIRYHARHMPPRAWVGAIAIASVCPLVDFLTSRKGTLFTEEAPRWVSKLGIGVGMGFGVLLVAILVSDRRNNKILDDSQVNEHDLWIPVSITVDDQPQKQRFDEGMILLENDVLLFSGHHYSFRVDLRDVEVTHFSLRKNWTALKENSTGRKLFIALANKYSLANWRLFIDQIQATAAPQGSPSLFAWKPRWLQSLAPMRLSSRCLPQTNY